MRQWNTYTSADVLDTKELKVFIGLECNQVSFSTNNGKTWAHFTPEEAKVICRDILEVIDRNDNI